MINAKTSCVAIFCSVFFAGTLQVAANAQSFITGTNQRTPFDHSFERFSASLDTLADDMAVSYERRSHAAARNNLLHADADLNNLAHSHHFHRRSMESQLFSVNPTNHSVSGVGNQGNNQGNNGYFGGNLFGFPFFGFGGLGSSFGSFGSNGQGALTGTNQVQFSPSAFPTPGSFSVTSNTNQTAASPSAVPQ